MRKQEALQRDFNHCPFSEQDHGIVEGLPIANVCYQTPTAQSKLENGETTRATAETPGPGIATRHCLLLAVPVVESLNLSKCGFSSPEGGNNSIPCVLGLA